MKTNRPIPRKRISRRAGTSAAPARWSWHLRALLALRDRLAAEAAELRKDGAGLLESEGPDAGDRAERRSTSRLIEAELRTEEGLLEEVEAALARLAAGRYGICEATGRRILPSRLRAIPWTRFTREAALGRERKS